MRTLILSCLLILPLSMFAASQAAVGDNAPTGEGVSIGKGAQVSIAEFPASAADAYGVSIAVALSANSDKLLVTFSPQPLNGQATHLYSSELQHDSANDIGMPTRFWISDSAQVNNIGSVNCLQDLSDPDADYPHYPAGPVTFSQAIKIAEDATYPIDLELRCSYMACSDQSCNRPVDGRILKVSIPAPETVAAATETASTENTATQTIEPTEAVTTTNEVSKPVVVNTPTMDKVEEEAATPVWIYILGGIFSIIVVLVVVKVIGGMRQTDA